MAFSRRNIKGTVTMALLSITVIFGALMVFNTEARSEQVFSLERVEAIEVCMVTDRVLRKPQIPIEYDDKTYYGCCQGCVSKIKNDRSVRYSIDPATGVEVDKATAYIMEGPMGEALYFESAQSAKQYSVKNAEQGGPVK